MIDLYNIKQYSEPRPNGWTAFGNAEEFDALPAAKREQVFFLNKQATDYLFHYLEFGNLVTGGGWEPFARGNFKHVEEFHDFFHGDKSRQTLKKWLYRRGLPFATEVFLLQNSEHAILTTWKMVVRYSPFIFYGDDVLVFDHTLNWCLFYYHENNMFFGRHNVYDPSEDEKKMREWNERKKKYPQFRHPYL